MAWRKPRIQESIISLSLYLLKNKSIINKKKKRRANTMDTEKDSRNGKGLVTAPLLWKNTRYCDQGNSYKESMKSGLAYTFRGLLVHDHHGKK